MLHHGIAYSCLRSDEAAVEALPNLGPFKGVDGLKPNMLCEQFFWVSASGQHDAEHPKSDRLAPYVDCQQGPPLVLVVDAGL